jgi:phage gpG-like protein
MRIGIRIEGTEEQARDLERAGDRLPQALDTQLRLASELIVGASQRNFKGERTRAEYEIKGGKRVRRKTPRPVTSPANMLGVFEGRYRQSISYTVTRHQNLTLSSEIGPVGVIYAPVHEFGLGVIPARPVLTPAIDSTRDRVYGLIGHAFKVVR